MNSDKTQKLKLEPNLTTKIITWVSATDNSFWQEKKASVTEASC